MDEDGNFYFMEMNGRVQVEHPAGERLRLGRVRRNGFAIEMRINAEDPDTFLPSPGKVEELVLPGGPGVRVDTHLYQGYTVPPYYDSLLAKIVVWGETREEAIRRGLRVLDELVIRGRGLKTNTEFHRRVLQSREFREGRHHIGFVEEMMV